MGRAEFLKLLLGGALSLQGYTSAAKDALTRPLRRKATPEAAPIRSVSLEAASVDPRASAALVTVRLSGSIINTVVVPVATRNGTDLFPDRRAIAGTDYSATSALVVFRPGDDPVKIVSIPILRAKPGRSFELVIPEEVQGAAALVTSARIVIEPGPAPKPQNLRGRPPKTPHRGALAFELDLARFKATDSGFSDGKPCWRTRFSDTRVQLANHELGIYTDPVVFPGTKPFEVRDHLLALRTEKLGSEIRDPASGQSFAFGSSLLTTQTLFSQVYGYFEWDMRLNTAPGTWSGLWLLPADGGWPPEIDVMEAPRNGRYGRGHTNVAAHWRQDGRHWSISARLPVDRLLGQKTDLVGDFHKHAVEWRPDFTTWFIDDVEIFQAPTHFHRPAYAIMDLTLGGWGGKPDLPLGYDEMVVRGMRVWR
jgi:hypothetical protein